MAMIDLVDIGFRFPSQTLIPTKESRSYRFSIGNLNLHIPHGKVTVILGPSGCGKSTLLRIIAGLIRQDSGDVLFNGQKYDGVFPGKRRIGMVFQDYALYPHYDAETNIISYFFFRKKTPDLELKRKEIFERTSALLGVEIKHLLRRKPPKLSGGEQQRVAMGRCITREPELFLLDEPFSNLDPRLREHYRVTLKQLLRQFSITTVYVTHDQREAVILADELVIMNEGRIEQRGKTDALYENPENMFVAGFLSFSSEMIAMNFFDGELLDREYAGAVVGVRPADIRLETSGKPGAHPAVVLDVRPLPINDAYDVLLGYKDTTLHCRLVTEIPPAAGQKLDLAFRKYYVFDKMTGTCTGKFVSEENGLGEK